MGGQSEYTVMHNTLLDKHTIFLVTISADLGAQCAESNSIKDWLRLIAAHAPGAHVIFVFTQVCLFVF